MRKRKFKPRVKEIYSNCALYDHKGLLCRCSSQRARWYLKMGLATVISENPLQVLLNFDPEVSLEQREAVYCVHKENKCCVCGEENIENLTKHHIIPLCFRKIFPENYKSSLSHDVVPVCDNCHVKYHKHAAIKIEQMYKQCDAITMNREKRIFFKESLGLCKALTLETLPKHRAQEMQQTLYSMWSNELEIEKIAEQCRQEIAARKKIEPKLCLEQVKDLEQFIIDWRMDFVNTMNPRFLPKGWSIDFRTTNWEK